MQVRVYRNLHKKCLSVQAKVNGAWRVIRHVDTITLTDVTFKVSQAGRERVLRERAKNVHAFVTGVCTGIELIPDHATRVSYNPYKAGTFMAGDTPVADANMCVVGTGGIFIW